MRSIFALLLLVVVATARLAPLLHLDNPTMINGSYIIMLNDDVLQAERDTHIAELESLLDAESSIGFKYFIGSAKFVGFSAKLSDALLKHQLTHPRVKYVEADQMMSIMDPVVRSPDAVITQTGATWGLARIDQHARTPVDTTYAYNSIAGGGVDVYVIDTGIYIENADFSGRATHSFNAISNEGNGDGNGHGTHCAGTVGGDLYGVAKKANLKAVKVLSAGGSGTNAGVIAGVDHVAQVGAGKPSIASMSLGGGVSTTLDNAVAAIIAAGVATAVAAGNNNMDACSFSPARTPSAVTVGATTDTDARASYSNYGICLDIFAPGSNVKSDWIGSRTATNTISGTSMACPHVAGAMALHLSRNPGTTPNAMTNWLKAQATSGAVSNPGTGSLNALLFSPQ